MAVFSVERHGFLTLYEMVTKIGEDLMGAGFHTVSDNITTPTIDAEATATQGTSSNPVTVVARVSPTYGHGVTSVTIVNPGTKYDPLKPPTVTFSAPQNTSYSTIMTDAGYTLFDTSASGTAEWNDPAIPGSDDVTLSTTQQNAMIVRATGNVVVSANGTVTGITITNPGYGYTLSETVTVTISDSHIESAKLLLESTTRVDPLGLKLAVDGSPLPASQQTGTQPWRIMFDLRKDAINSQKTGGALGVYLGTFATLRNDGTVGSVVVNSNTTSPTKVEPAGNIGAKWTGGVEVGRPQPNLTNLDQCFLNRMGRSDPDVAAAYPLSYRLTVTNRGVFLGVWEANAEELGYGFNWLLVQRAVDRLTGVTRGSTPETAAGRCPVFCINSVNNKYYKFVVREADLIMPSERKLANENVEDSSCVINTLNQQSLTESGEYVITFISNLNSARYKYADELDMIGTVSADIVGAATALDVTVYGETQARTYHALYPNGAFGTGMRLMVLKSNPNET